MELFPPFKQCPVFPALPSSLSGSPKNVFNPGWIFPLDPFFRVYLFHPPCFPMRPLTVGGFSFSVQVPTNPGLMKCCLPRRSLLVFFTNPFFVPCPHGPVFCIVRVLFRPYSISLGAEASVQDQSLPSVSEVLC